MILLQIHFQVSQEKTKNFEAMYRDVYVPALNKQRGYIRSNLLCLFDKAAADEIEAAPTEFNYQMELVFDTEENRLKWVDSPEHQKAWPAAEALIRKAAWRGYDVVDQDR